jgi:hypothetical protein
MPTLATIGRVKVQMFTATTTRRTCTYMAADMQR